MLRHGRRWPVAVKLVCVRYLPRGGTGENLLVGSMLGAIEATLPSHL